MEAIILKTETGYFVEPPHHSGAILFTENLLGATMYNKKDRKHLLRAIRILHHRHIPYRKMKIELNEI